MDYPETPELDKMREFKDEAGVIFAFLEWLFNDEKVGLFRVEMKEGEIKYTPFCENVNEILAKFFQLDLSKVKEEQAEVVRYITLKHGDKEPPAFSMKVEGEELGEPSDVHG